MMRGHRRKMYNMLSQNRISGPSATFYRHFDQGRGLLAKAVELDEKLKSDSSRATIVEAIDTYKKVLEFFSQAQKLSNSLDMKQLTPEERKKFVGNLERLHQFLPSVKDRYAALNQKLADCDNGTITTCTRVQPRVPPGLNPSASATRPVYSYYNRGKAVENSTEFNRVPRSELLRGVDRKFGEKLLDEVLDSTGVSLCDISGCLTAKTALEEAVLLPALNPGLFSGLRQPVKGILLFGPPGNGKTMLAKAVATDTKQTFFNISASSLTSKWVGDGEKTVRTLFQMARNAQPCIIFIDEVDSILCSRSDKEAESSRRLKTEFLLQFDGATSNADERLLVIGATNRPQELDDAVLRRFPKRIFIPLPDDASRYSAIKSILHKHGMSRGLCDSEYKYIASRTSGYSYADLFAVCQEAAMVPVRTIDKKNLARTTAAQIRPLKLSDFDHAVSVIRPSVNHKNLEQLQEFANKSGQTS